VPPWSQRLCGRQAKIKDERDANSTVNYNNNNNESETKHLVSEQLRW